MIVLILVVAAGYFMYHIIKDMLEENAYLRGQSLAQKISRTVQVINDKVYNGMGDIIDQEKRSFSLYQKGGDQIIRFQYETGALIITWRYLLFHLEVAHEKVFHNIRNLSLEQQEKIAILMIHEMEEVIDSHKRVVVGVP